MTDCLEDYDAGDLDLVRELMRPRGGSMRSGRSRAAAMMPRGRAGESPDGLGQAAAIPEAKTETCAVRASGESAERAEPVAIDRPSLRARLIAMRDDLRARLVEGAVVEPSWLATLAHAETVLQALDREAP